MGTSTSSFGVGKRESHDSTDFYARFAPPEVSDDDTLGEPGELDVIHVGDARDMAAVPDASVALVVTSPPYFAGKEYETALGEGHVPGDYLDYLPCSATCSPNASARSSPAGASAINVANLGSAPVPQPGRRRHHHPAGRPPVAAAWRGHLAEAAWCERLVCLGFVSVAGQPGAARHDRAGDHRQQGTLRSGRYAVGVARRTWRGHDPRRRVHGGNARRLGDPRRERHTCRPPGAVSRCPRRALPPAVHLRRRRRPRPVHGIGNHRGRGGEHRASLRRLRHRSRLRRAGSRAGRVDGAGAAPRSSER